MYVTEACGAAWHLPARFSPVVMTDSTRAGGPCRSASSAWYRICLCRYLQTTAQVARYGARSGFETSDLSRGEAGKTDWGRSGEKPRSDGVHSPRIRALCGLAADAVGSGSDPVRSVAILPQATSTRRPQAGILGGRCRRRTWRSCARPSSRTVPITSKPMIARRESRPSWRSGIRAASSHPSWPRSEPDTYRGHDGLRRYINDLAASWEEWQNEVEEIFDVGADTVFATIRSRVIGKGSGATADSRRAAVFVLSKGKIVRGRTYASRRGGPRSRGAAGVGDVAGQRRGAWVPSGVWRLGEEKRLVGLGRLDECSRRQRHRRCETALVSRSASARGGNRGDPCDHHRHGGAGPGLWIASPERQRGICP